MSKLPIARLSAALAVALLLGQAPSSEAAAPPKAAKRVRVEHFVPKGKGPFPAVVLLHGLDGMEESGGVYRTLAKCLAEEGYVAVLVHYFERTGTKKEDLPRLLKQFRSLLDDAKERDRERQALEATFTAWLGAVREAIDDVRKHPRVDAERVALIGFSLGGFLATSAAALEPLKVRCVAELFGGLPRSLAGRAKAMPPTLIVHGDRDEVVPVREAEALRDLLTKGEREVELKLYRGVGHCFVSPKGGIDWVAALDAKQRTLSFLARHLSQRRASQTPQR
jgi:carboxymethylenebutenolidase